MKRRSTADVEAYREHIDSLLEEAQHAVMTEGERAAAMEHLKKHHVLELRLSSEQAG